MEKFKKATIANVFVSIAFILLGLMLTFKPNVTLSVIVNVIGIIIVAFGVLKLFNYFKLKTDFAVFEYDLLFGIIGIVLGIVIMVFGKEVAALFRVIIGIWIIYNAILRMQLSLYLKKVNSSAWIYTIAFAILILLCGIYITFRANAIISTIGIVMIVYAVMDLIENMITLKNLKDIYIQ